MQDEGKTVIFEEVKKPEKPQKAPIKKAVSTNVANKKQQAKTIFLLMAALLAGFIGGYAGSSANSQTSKTSTSQQRQVISSESDLIAEIAKDVGQSVVSIDVTSSGLRTDAFFGFTRQVEQASAGTGFILSEDGIVMTNRHVIPKGTTSVTVTLADGTKLDSVEVIGRTSDSDSLDVAFLKIKDKKGKSLKPVKLGDSSKVKVGERVVAIGNALGQFQNTVTSGIISGYGRDVVAGDSTGDAETLTNLFQTDASINQGNSGGPLVNINGEVIGINTAVAGGNNTQNIGFSIPIDDVKGLVASVLEQGKLVKPYLGVRYVSLTDDYAYRFNLNTKRGAYIAPQDSGKSILDNSPASKADLKEKDIITKVNGLSIDEKTSLASALGRYKVGDEVTLTIVRDGKEQQVKVKLEAAPDTTN